MLLGRAETPSTAGRVELPKESSITAGDTWAEVLKERRCDSQGRGSLYDSKAGKFKAQGSYWHTALLHSTGRCLVLIGCAHAGITCHFCRQKKLCGEPDCPRCSERNPELQCIGKHSFGSSLHLLLVLCSFLPHFLCLCKQANQSARGARLLTGASAGPAC